MKYEGWIVGARIKRLRKEKRMTAVEFGIRLGVSTSHIQQIEQGGRKMSVDLLCRILDVLEIDANTLLGIETCHHDGISIDEAIEELSEKQRNYFRTIFLQMIQKLPA